MRRTGTDGATISTANTPRSLLARMQERAQRQETFVFVHEERTFRWDVSAAWRLLITHPRQPVVFRPAEQGIDIHHVMDRYGDLNVGYALTCDLTMPLLFVPFLGRHQLVDGWHRLLRSDT